MFREQNLTSDMPSWTVDGGMESKACYDPPDYQKRRKGKGTFWSYVRSVAMKPLL